MPTGSALKRLRPIEGHSVARRRSFVPEQDVPRTRPNDKQDRAPYRARDYTLSHETLNFVTCFRNTTVLNVPVGDE